MWPGEAPAIGIDLGTTNSCVAVYRNGQMEVIKNFQGNKKTPSYVAFTDTGRLIGSSAKNQVVQNPTNTVCDSKRLIGRRFDDPRLQKDLKNWQFQVTNEEGRPRICAEVQKEAKTFAPEEIGAMLLTKMKEVAESYLQLNVVKAVISVPACFSSAQRQATMDAGEIAGLKVIRMISEPTAAAFAYGLHREMKGSNTVMVFDLGGGVLDVSVYNIYEAMLYQVMSIAGNPNLGGRDFDDRMVAHFAEEFRTQHEGKDLRGCPEAVWKLRNACEAAKKTLSRAVEATIDVPSLYEGIDFKSKMTRKQFEEICADLFQAALKEVERALADAGIDDKTRIDDVILVGGSTRIPKIPELLCDFFEKPLFVSGDDAVAYGAAAQAAALTAAGHDKMNSTLSVDLVPLTLGVKDVDDFMSAVVKKGTTLPDSKGRFFSTDSHDQTKIVIEVFEGEARVAEDNPLLGTFTIDHIPEAPEGGFHEVEVMFRVNHNGILNIGYLSSRHTPTITVSQDFGSLSSEEILRMTREAKRSREEDAAQRRRNENWSDLQGYVHMVKQTVEESSDDRLSAAEKAAVVASCKSYLRWIESNPLATAEEIEKKMSEVRESLDPCMTRLYEYDYRGKADPLGMESD